MTISFLVLTCWWKILNSPLVVALVSISAGGLVATGLSICWRKKALRFQARLDAIKKLLDADEDWLNSLHGAEKDNQVFVIGKLGSVIKTHNIVRLFFTTSDTRDAGRAYLEFAESRTKVVGTADTGAAEKAEIDVGNAFRQLIALLFSKLELVDYEFKPKGLFDKSRESRNG